MQSLLSEPVSWQLARAPHWECYDDLSLATDKSKVLPLCCGDGVGIASPSYLGTPNIVDDVIQYLDQKGLVPIWRDRCPLYCYAPEERQLLLENCELSRKDSARELEDLFRNQHVRTIFCQNGGDGVIHALQHLDFEVMSENPTLLVGFSDITSLLCAIQSIARLPVIHGAVLEHFSLGKTPEARLTEDALFRLLSDRSFQPLAQLEMSSLVPGKAEGEIIGGNLQRVASIFQTRYLPNVSGKILLLEEVEESPRRVKENLLSLHLRGAFKQCSGVLLGDFSSCVSQENRQDSVYERIDRFLHENHITCPVFQTTQIGHGAVNLPVPFGVRARLDRNGVVFAESLFDR